MPPQVPFQVKLKTCLQMCIQRLRYAQEKQQAIAKQGRRDVAQLLRDSKDQKASYRVEGLINDDIHIELLEILELYCELLRARVAILNTIDNETDLIEKHTQDGINEGIRSLIYSSLYAPEIRELLQVKDLLTMKFGTEFTKLIITDNLGVPDKILRKCSPGLPNADLIQFYLKEISNTYDVPYNSLKDDVPSVENIKLPESEPTSDSDEKPIIAGENDSIEVAKTDDNHPITIRKARKDSDSIASNLKIPDELKKDVKLVTNHQTKSNANAYDEIEELKKRFAALRK